MWSRSLFWRGIILEGIYFGVGWRFQCCEESTLTEPVFLIGGVNW